ncbi:hypothetical protein RMP76_082 [Saccharomyces cerevisiae synthetic construct]|uniref:Putative uncharacterized protein YHR028W-A n=1 Tax=Saccharomyces cerevisiae (strain ATCC 204508 / S288c) TaxID=559292 RepID=YH028_YEAST|nr:RecName: Full=Putative uncharacterized protein YHR028W-A [Saccharomyces cerevisiae S288C]AHX39299.1 putative membrane protein [Saccharomyces cerevisiae]WNM96943.1 hypothetical protein RMP76_082 [Saccharomyces cerevisiae synthetic construct]
MSLSNKCFFFVSKSSSGMRSTSSSPPSMSNLAYWYVAKILSERILRISALLMYTLMEAFLIRNSPSISFNTASGGIEGEKFGREHIIVINIYIYIYIYTSTLQLCV